MIQLKDLTSEYIRSQLESQYSEFEHIAINDARSQNIDSDALHGGSSADVIAYLALHGKGEVFKKVLLNFKFNNNDRALEICEHLHELVSRASIECCDLDDSELIQSLATYGTSRSIRTVQDFIESTDRSLSFAECYVKICKVDNTALRVTVIQTQTTPLSTRFEQFVKELAKLNELYTDVVQHIQQHNLKRLEKVYTEALELFNELNAYAISQIRSANIQDASEREFYICDVCLDDDQFSNTTESFDLVRDLKISELLDPFKTSESLKRPKGLIEELENLCNHNIVKRYSMKNDDLPNRISIVDARKRVLIELINHPNTIRKLAFKHLNDRLETSQPRSKERKVLRHFKQEIQPYVDKMIDIYDNLQIYIDAPFNQRLTDEMIDALNKDLENGNNDEKRRIIDEVSIAIKEIEQLSQSIHDAYQDMLIHAYSTES